jgi:RNA polymerase sigma-70 factor (ECF subfamily)
MNQMEEDFGLIDEYLSGESSAFERLVLKYQKQIYALAYRMLNDKEEAKDMTQETFVKMMRGVSGFKRHSSFKTWLYQIAINTCINRLKQRRNKETYQEDLIVDGGHGHGAEWIEKEKKDRIRAGLQGLTERERLAMVLRVYEGMSCSETAKVMGCSEGAVKAHYHNGVKRLKLFMKEQGYDLKS